MARAQAEEIFAAPENGLDEKLFTVKPGPKNREAFLIEFPVGGVRGYALFEVLLGKTY